jgi:hypothetical protein
MTGGLRCHRRTRTELAASENPVSVRAPGYGFASSRSAVDCTEGVRVAGVESDVLEQFTERLEGSDAVPAAVAEQLRTLLAQDKLPKPEVLVALYTAESGDRLA